MSISPSRWIPSLTFGSTILKRYTSLPGFYESTVSGNPPEYENASRYSNELVDSWYAYHSIIDAIETGKMHLDQSMPSTNLLLAQASNNFNRPGCVVSSQPRDDGRGIHKQNHEKPCFEENADLE